MASKKRISFLSLCLSLVSVFFVIGCISSPYQGLFVTNSSHHVYGKQVGTQLSSANVEKMVESCSSSNSIAHNFYYGQGEDTTKLLKDNGISKIAVIDRRSVSILSIFFYQECVQIYGE